MEMPGAGGSFAGLKLPRGQHVDPLLEPQDEVACDKKLWFVPKRALAAKMDSIGMGAGLRARRSRGGFGEAAVLQAREMILKKRLGGATALRAYAFAGALPPQKKSGRTDAEVIVELARTFAQWAKAELTTRR